MNGYLNVVICSYFVDIQNAIFKSDTRHKIINLFLAPN